jgi:hypothetical protein
MILPTDITPNRIGLAWGMTKDQCLSTLGMKPVRQTDLYASVNYFSESDFPLDLEFDDDRLTRIQLDLHVSRDFWEDYTTEDVEAIASEFEHRFERLVLQYSDVLGPPDFSGRWGDDSYPEDETVAVLSYWESTEGRVQVEFDQPDTEFPFVIRLACLRRQND